MPPRDGLAIGTTLTELGRADSASIGHQGKLTRPRSAISLRQKERMKRVKDCALSVSQASLDDPRPPQRIEREALKSHGLMLDGDSKLRIREAVGVRERAMQSLLATAQRRYNDTALVGDQKEEKLAKLASELALLEGFAGRGTASSSSSKPDAAALAARRLEAVSAELEQAEEASGMATHTTASLRMMTERLRRQIQTRSEQLRLMEQSVTELRTSVGKVTSHQRVLASGEAEAAEQRDRQARFVASRQRLYSEQLGRRRAMVLALSDGSKKGAELAEQAEEANARLRAHLQQTAAEQEAVRWSLDSRKDAHQKLHVARSSATLLEAELRGTAPAGQKASSTPASATAAKSAAQPGAQGAAAAPPRRPATAGPTVAGRRVPRSSSAGSLLHTASRGLAKRFVLNAGALAQEQSLPRTLSGASMPLEVGRLRNGPFGQYMQRVFKETGVSDPAYVLRRLRHWQVTESTQQEASAEAQRRHRALSAQYNVAAADLAGVRASTLVTTSEAAPAAPAASEQYDLADTIGRASARAARAELARREQARLLNDSQHALHNLTARLRRGMQPALLDTLNRRLADNRRRQERAEGRDQLVPDRDLFGEVHSETEGGAAAASGGHGDEEGGGGADSHCSSEAEDHETPQGAPSATRATPSRLPRMLGTLELTVTTLLAEVEARRPSHRPQSAAAARSKEVATARPARIASEASCTGVAASAPGTPARAGGDSAATAAASQPPSPARMALAAAGPGSPAGSPFNDRRFADEGMRGSLERSEDEHAGDEEATADEACVYIAPKKPPRHRPLGPTPDRRKLLAAAASAPAPAPADDDAVVLDREGRKNDSIDFIERQKDRRQREEKESKEAPVPRFYASRRQGEASSSSSSDDDGGGESPQPRIGRGKRRGSGAPKRKK